MKLSKKKLLLFSSAALIAGLLLAEGACSLLVLADDYLEFRRENRTEPSESRASYSGYDPDLGWTNIPGAVSKDCFGAGKDVTINRQGVRSLRDYAEKTSETFRLLCLGDSFTQGYGAGDEECYPAQIEKLNSRVEAINMGEVGYSLGQTYLWYLRDGDQFAPDFVLWAIIQGDFDRLQHGVIGSENKIPRFELENGELKVSNIPVPRRTRANNHDYERMKLMRFLKNHDPFIRATTRASLLFKTRNADVQDRGDDQLRKTGLEIMRKLHRHAEERHRGFAIVLLPIWEEMFVPQSASAYEGTRRMLEKFCKDEQMAFCDLKDPFVKKYGVEGSAPLFDRRSRHYSAAGYREMAERINGWLAEIEPRYPSPVSQVLNGDKP